MLTSGTKSLGSEVGICSTRPVHLWNSKVNCRVSKSLPLNHNLSEVNRSHILAHRCAHLKFNVKISSTPPFPGWLPSVRFTEYNFARISHLVRVTCPAHLIFFVLITVIISGKAFDYEVYQQFSPQSVTYPSQTPSICIFSWRRKNRERVVNRVAYGRTCSWGRVRLKCDGTRAETRFRLSAERTSPFKSARASVQSTTGSRGVHMSVSNAGYTMFRGSVKSTGYSSVDYWQPRCAHQR
jgi:hypothetical protein